MIQKDENYLSMASTAVKVLEANEAVWSGNGPVADCVNNIKEDITSVKDAQKGGQSVSTGAAIDKEIAGDKAIERAVRLSGLTQAYALGKDDHTLNDQMKVSFTGLDRLPDNVLSPALTRLYDTMYGLGSALVPFGVTPDELAAFKNDIDVFDGIKSNPRVIITERKGHNASIPVLLREIRASFYKLDRLVKIWETTNSKFVTDYQNARIIIDLGTRHEQTPTPPNS